MPPSLNRLVDHLRRTASRVAGEPASDGELLERFISQRDALAFELLLRRHAPMVLGVCQRVIGNHHDAEDAFQATFLVLVRKAARIRPREAVGTWLYGVAYRTALGARSRLARRRARERTMPNVPALTAGPDGAWHDLRPVLDREMNALPDKYRLPIVLCDLEGRGRKEVASALAIPEGTLSSRLATARKLLAARLTRRGVTLSVGALVALLAQNSASASVPGVLLLSTTQAALLFAAGPAAAAGLMPGPAAALTEGVLRMMFLAKLKMTAAVVVAVTAVGLGTGGLLYQARAGMGEPGDGQPAGPQLTRQDPDRKVGNAEARLADLLDQLKRARREAEAARQEAVAQRQRAEAERARAEAVVRQTQARLKAAVQAEAKAKQSASESSAFLRKDPLASPDAQAQRQRLAEAEAQLVDKFEHERQRLQKEQMDLMAQFGQQRQKLLAEQDRLDAEQQARLKELHDQLDKLKRAPTKQPGSRDGAANRGPDTEKVLYAFSCRHIRAEDAAKILKKELSGERIGLMVSADARANTLIVAVPKERMKMVADMMQKIDRPEHQTQPAASRDKLDLILERLDRVEHRLDRIEHRQESPRNNRPAQ